MPKRSLASRAVMALVLAVGFYVLAVGIALGLLGAVYAELYSSHILVKPTILAIIGAGIILWSILPRIDRFTAPGPRLEADAQPELFAVIRDVAAKSEQAMPREVYLLPEVNAWVMQRGGLAGIGSRRVMGIGLALLQSVDVAQFRAIVAHEFGHYHAGDTTLGPWIYKTRMAMVRTIQNLGRSTLHKPFLWYGNFFLKVTQAISRAQEHAADLLAAKIAGARAAIGALTVTHRAGVAYDAYWRNEVLPVLSNGFRPPIAAGLTQFMSCEEVEQQLGQYMERELTEGKAETFDSHPPLRERIAELEPLARADEPASGGPLAVTLLRNLDELEAELIRPMFRNPQDAAKLQSLRWDDAPMRVYAPQWRQRAEHHAAVLREITMSGLPEAAKTLPQLAVRFELAHVPEAEAVANTQAILGCAVATRLLDDGWVCDTAPGAPVVMQKEGRRVMPFSVVSRMASGELTGTAWIEECEAAGIAARPLA
jgi:Zn-dependent protease with chaperone function